MMNPWNIAADDQAAANLRDRQAASSEAVETMAVSCPESTELLDLWRSGDVDKVAAWTEAQFAEQAAARELLAGLDDQ